MTPEQIQHCGDELYAALRARRTIAPLTSRIADITIDNLDVFESEGRPRHAVSVERVV